MNGHRHFPRTPTITLLCTLAIVTALPTGGKADVGQDPATRPAAERLATETLAQWSPWGGELTEQELDVLKPALIGYFLSGELPRRPRPPSATPSRTAAAARAWWRAWRA